MLPTNLGRLFDGPLRLTPSRPAVLEGDRVVTFEELDARCNQVAHALLDLGIRHGDRVGLMFANDLPFLECLFGTMRIGAVAVPLNVRSTDEALTYVLGDSDAALLIAGPGMTTRARGLASNVPAMRHLIVSESYDSLLQRFETALEARATQADDICMQPYTSGSTGRPKGVLLTHGGQIWNANIMREALTIDQTDRALVAVPLCHKNAMIGAVKPFLLAGGSLVILPGFDPLAVIDAIEESRRKCFGSAPYQAVRARVELTRLWCGTAVPFGRPVEPEVWIT